MSTLSRRLLARYYANIPHPYQLFEREVDSLIDSGIEVLLDAGCGRTVPVLRRYLGRVPRLIGVDLVDFTDVPSGTEAHKGDLSSLPMADGSVDLIMSRSVFEHLTDPESVYREFARVLKPGGHIVFLTANLWDYGTMVARLVPNRLHGRVVKLVEGRPEEDTFPTAYKTNTRSDVTRLATAAGLDVIRFDYLSQYPNYLMFNGALFLLGTAYEKLISRVHALRFLRGWMLVTLAKR